MNKERFLDIATGAYVYYQKQGISFIPSTLDVNDKLDSNCFIICHSNYLRSESDFAYSQYNLSLCTNSFLPNLNGTTYKLDQAAHNHGLGSDLNIYFLPKFSAQEQGVDITHANILCDIGSDITEFNYYAIVASPRIGISQKFIQDYLAYGIEIFPLRNLF